MKKNTKEINRRKNSQRAVKGKIKIYNYGLSPFGEPSQWRLELLQCKKVTLRTYRHDYRQFSFVKCLLNGQIKILVIKFESNKVERLSCQLLEKWDPRYSFV